MDLSKISSEDWSEFNTRFPTASAFLTNASLRGEVQGLLRGELDGTLNEWQISRLAELRGFLPRLVNLGDEA